MPEPPSLTSLLAQAAALHKSGALAEAADRYRQIVSLNPSHAGALYRLAQICCQQGRFDEGVELARRVLSLEPYSARPHILLGRALAELGDLQSALTSFDRALGCDAGDADAHGHRGDVLAQLGRRDEAVESYQRAIALAPDALANWCNLGMVQAELGRLNDALASYDHVVTIDSSFAEAHFSRSFVLARLGRSSEALASLERGLVLTPDHPGALVSRGDVLRALSRHEEALVSYQHALQISPKLVSALTGCASAFVALKRPRDALASLDQALMEAPVDGGADIFSNRASLLRSLDRHDEALASADRALQINPHHVDALMNRGAVLSDLGRYSEALICYDRALSISPGDVRASCNRAKTLLALGRVREALSAIEKAPSVEPLHVESVYVLGMVLSRLHRYDEAIAALQRVLEEEPTHPHALAQLALNCLAICEWDKGTAVSRRLYGQMAAGTAIVAPHLLLQLSCGPDMILAGTRRYMESEIPAVPQLRAGTSLAHGSKIKVAYISGDFRVHPVAYLTAELFERHDRRRFEIIGLSFGPNDQSDVRSRIEKSFDQFYDARSASDRDVAMLVQKMGIDIAVDLGGHTENSRPAVLAYRAAPIQVNYLGYAGTMGANFIDYIIADETVLPFEQQPYYTEKIVHLPDCFLVNDGTRPISRDVPCRSDVGLPDHGFVFCCFNNAYKISAEIFDRWMRLLKATEGSVLWLSQLNSTACDNLRAAARAAGVDTSRIVFAPRVQAMADHLARHRLADLFLDTPGYNAHSTACDALWAGLPVVTCIGSTFPGRVAASLLRSVGLPDMVVANLDDYEDLALKLAHDNSLLVGIRERLHRNRSTHPLFDTDRFRRHIERAYETMWEIHRRGERPHSFSVEAIGPSGR